MADGLIFEENWSAKPQRVAVRLKSFYCCCTGLANSRARFYSELFIGEERRAGGWVGVHARAEEAWVFVCLPSLPLFHLFTKPSQTAVVSRKTCKKTEEIMKVRQQHET